jgi:hypothetical protein
MARKFPANGDLTPTSGIFFLGKFFLGKLKPSAMANTGGRPTPSRPANAIDAFAVEPGTGQVHERWRLVITTRRPAAPVGTLAAITDARQELSSLRFGHAANSCRL